MSGSSGELDERARAIVERAQGDDPVADRAVDTVHEILTTYYPDDAHLIVSITYEAGHPGLGMTYEGRGPDTSGRLRVGRYYIDNVTPGGIARRVLQVGHELEHVRQQRAGMSGHANKRKREFLAFLWEATVAERPGTGKMPHATRVLLIDEALRNYYALPEDERRRFARHKEALLTLRESEQELSGRSATQPPRS